jgi:hypothetical protein
MSACTDYIKTIYPDECVGDSLSTINSNFSALQVVTCELEQRFDKNKQVRTFFYYGPNAGVDVTSGMADNSTSRPSDLTIQSFVNSPEQLNLPLISRDGDTAYVVYQKTGFKNNLSPNIPSDFRWGKAVTENIITPGTNINISYDTWYNVSEYYSAIGYCNGGLTGNRLGTVTLTFRTPSGLTSSYSYRATGVRRTGGDDTYVEWNQDNVILSEGYPIQKTAKSITSRPYKDQPGTQFRFTRSGKPFQWFATGTSKQTTTVKGGDVASDIINEFSPVLIIWKLTYNGEFYTVDVGFPKFTRASTSNSNFTNWNNPTAWSQY